MRKTATIVPIPQVIVEDLHREQERADKEKENENENEIPADLLEDSNDENDAFNSTNFKNNALTSPMNALDAVKAGL